MHHETQTRPGLKNVIVWLKEIHKNYWSIWDNLFGFCTFTQIWVCYNFFATLFFPKKTSESPEATITFYYQNYADFFYKMEALKLAKFEILRKYM